MIIKKTRKINNQATSSKVKQQQKEEEENHKICSKISRSLLIKDPKVNQLWQLLD